MALEIIQIDAFTDRPFAGNPAAVCVLEAPADAGWMQAVATEMNLSETAFLVRRDDGSYDLRWFTPAAEVDLCGHATLASAHALWETRRLALDDEAVFHTLSGTLRARRKGAWIEMDFPAEPPSPCPPPDGLLAALDIDPELVAKNRLDSLVLLSTEDVVRRIAPDFRAIKHLGMRGVIVTGPSSDPACDFVSRYFAPAFGVDEDPVTGSAHCCLGPFWAERLGRDDVTGYQASARGGVVKVRVAGDRVILGGQAVTVLHGALETIASPTSGCSAPAGGTTGVDDGHAVRFEP